MSRIKLLPETLASQVAAGEVVERPASVVKELIENSIDAGANHIEVRIQRGGISLIRVIDDGCGMDRDDALLSLERHATSKIASMDDLAAINTLGFRGEALPSIASVCRFRLTTRERDAIAGTEIVVNGGRIDTVRDGGEASGTQIEVRSLFFNVPARRKFLRSETTETRNVEHQFFLQALAHPQIAFMLARDEKPPLQLPAMTSLRDRIRDLYGAQLLNDLLPIGDGEIDDRSSRNAAVAGSGSSRDAGAGSDGLAVARARSSSPPARVRISGLIGRAGISRQTRAQQFVFVNGRAIDSGIVTSALREGYHTALMRGQYPVTFLFIDLDPRDVDVNVHPTKREVRFRDPGKVREAIVVAVQLTLAQARGDWRQRFDSPPSIAGGTTSVSLPISPPLEPEVLPAATPVIPSEVEGSRGSYLSVSQRDPSASLGMTLLISKQAKNANRRTDQHFQIIGVLNRLYVLMENSDGLVLVDQHAAHERILFEELRSRMEEQGVPAQRMLLPQIFSLPPRDAAWVERNMATLQKMGIGVEGFGANSFRIDSLPAFLEVSDAGAFLRKVIDELKNTARSASPLRLGEDMIAKTVCRHAVKANDRLDYPEIEKLIRDLLACELPYCCPHGRPTMIQISLGELEKKFGRKA